jgi:hypothetical protein
LLSVRNEEVGFFFFWWGRRWKERSNVGSRNSNNDELSDLYWSPAINAAMRTELRFACGARGREVDTGFWWENGRKETVQNG